MILDVLVATATILGLAAGVVLAFILGVKGTEFLDRKGWL